ncbi:hypothetical protein RJ640_010729, partial [Escallonia rubra]
SKISFSGSNDEDISVSFRPTTSDSDNALDSGDFEFSEECSSTELFEMVNAQLHAIIDAQLRRIRSHVCSFATSVAKHVSVSRLAHLEIKKNARVTTIGTQRKGVLNALETVRMARGFLYPPAGFCGKEPTDEALVES